MNTVFITGADRGIGFALCEEYLEHGWKVFAGRYLTYWGELDKLQEKWKEQLVCIPIDVSEESSIKAAAEMTAEQTDHLDMLVNVAGIASFEDTPENIRRLLKVNSVGSVCVTEAFLPLMQSGMKRLCYFSSEAGSISLAHRKDSYGYGMSKTALNMAVKLMFNRLRSEGYTFRLYHPGWVKSYMAGDTMSTVGTYMPEDAARTAYLSFTQNRRSEDVLVLTDIENETWSF